ncbi:MAG: CHAD domain-containing protein [Candidatus Omnitrophica bacterium]|nr:CHAD domain-containing protein [Candidatus Omnitrophota bacterium]
MLDEKIFFSQVIQGHLTAALVEEKAVRKSKDDIESLHRMRVAFRRLKSALSDLKDVMLRRELELPSTGVKALLSILGHARDMDTKIVFLEMMAATPEAKAYAIGIREIIDELSEDRAEVQPKILKAFDRARREKVFRAIERLHPDLESADITLDEWAKNRITVRLEKMLRWEPYVKKPRREKELHEMRIAAKNLRYCLENFEALYGKTLGVYVKAATQVQASLGEVHNYDVWLGLLEILRASSTRSNRFSEALRFLRRACEGRRVKAYADFLDLWQEQKRLKLWVKLDRFADA